MAEIYGSHFEYGGISSTRYGLMIANLETERFKQISGNVESVTLFNKSSRKRYLIDDNYTDSPLTIEVEILTDNQKVLDPIEKRQVEKWLFNNRKYQKFYLSMGDDSSGETFEYVDGVCKRLYLNCRFINPVRIERNDGIVGYKATLEADSDMWWQDAITKAFTTNHADASSNSMITVDIDTDLKGFVYPKVTFQTGNVGGSVIIANYTDDSTRATRFVELPTNTSITMNGETNYISGQYYDNFYRQNFLRFVDGKNYIYISGDIQSIVFEFSNRRFL
ncbi:MAG: hypothetical protein II388_05430 [Clostridia bacterium]|nr:hypothetical protein [Clostridia bacterium]